MDGIELGWAVYTPVMTHEGKNTIKYPSFPYIIILPRATPERKEMTKGIEVIKCPNKRSTKAQALSNLFLLCPRAPTYL